MKSNARAMRREIVLLPLPLVPSMAMTKEGFKVLNPEGMTDGSHGGSAAEPVVIVAGRFRSKAGEGFLRPAGAGELS
jgi:hypothetical protein